MSIKNEVNQLTEVYRKIINENLEGGVNIGVPTGLPNPLDSTSNLGGSNLDSNVPNVQMTDNEVMGMPMPSNQHAMDEDTNASMAKTEVYKIVKASSELLKMLMNNECTEIEPWQLSKLTKASDYVCAVKESIEFDEFEQMASELNNEIMGSSSPVVLKVKDMLASETLEVNEEILKQVIFNIECLKEAQDNEDEEKHGCKFAKENHCKCDECEECRSNQ